MTQKTLWLYGKDIQKPISGLPGLHSLAFSHHRRCLIPLLSLTQLHSHADTPCPPSNRQSWGALTACCPEPAVPNPANLLQRKCERADNLFQLQRHKRGHRILGRPQSTWKVNLSNVSHLCPGKQRNRLIEPKLLTHRILSKCLVILQWPQYWCFVTQQIDNQYFL